MRIFHPFRLITFAAALLAVVSQGQSLAALTSAKVIIGGRNIPFLVTPFVGQDGQVYVPVEAVRLLGANFNVANNGVSATVTSATGRTQTFPCLVHDGHSCLPLQKAAVALGANADWQPTTQTLAVRARLEMVRQSGGSLAVYTSYPVGYQVQHLEKPARIYVDLYGLDLASTPSSIPVMEDEDHPGNILRIRSGQLNYNTVRITLDLKRDMVFRVASSRETSHVRIALAENASSLPTEVASLPINAQPSDHSPLPVVTARGTDNLPPLPIAPSIRTHPLPIPAPPRVVVNPPRPVLPAVPAAQGVRITSVNLKPATDGTMQIVVAASGPARFRTETLSNPNRLAFDLAGASLDAGVNLSLPGTGPIIKSVRSGILQSPQTQFGRVVVDLSRLVGFSVSSEAGVNGSMFYTLTLRMPHIDEPGKTSGGVNGLSGKIVVVDPGHGADDTGALGVDGSREKDITLQVGMKLRDALTRNGATVYMTRDDDSKPSVNARPLFAVQHNADYFISVHCDSSGAQNTHTGTTVYFHAQNAICRRLASDIVAQVASASGIPANGVKSDTIRFATGFGVLRGSPMPAVLVECGYMNNDSDLAKLKDDATQQNIALGIVAGLRDFIVDRTARR